MKAISGNDFAKLLEKKGWELGRTKGSHHIYVKEGNTVRISVPIHGNKPLKLGLLKHLMKVAGIDEASYDMQYITTQSSRTGLPLRFRPAAHCDRTVSCLSDN